MSDEKKEKKTKREKFLSLFKKNPLIDSKKSLKKFKERKKEEVKIFLEAAKELQRAAQGNVDDSIATIDDPRGDREIYFYDFVSEIHSGGNGFNFGREGDSEMPIQPIGAMQPRIAPDGTSLLTGSSTMALDSVIEEIKPKVTLKPIDVFKELETIPTPITLENLEEKIMTLKLKAEFIRSNMYAKKEVIDMITRIENRRKWDEYKEFFERFDNTTTDKVNALVNKYELVLKSADLFIPKFPKEAMEIMKEYKDNVKKLCGKAPIFYVIAEKAMFKSEDKRNDPILLVQSAFGIYWQILGAWDKELVLLEEL